MLHTQALWYSADRQISIRQLKDANPQDCPIVDQVRRYCQTHHITSMVSDQPGFHLKRQTIRPLPHILYLMGDVSVLDRQMIAIVGPRMPSHYGKKIVGHIVDQLAGYDVATISGLADGIDMLCHHRSLDLQIPTVAVLGGGIHYFLTREKRSLIDRIVGQGGLIVSEYKLDAKPTNYSFPQRNRLIAGLSHLMILPEAGIKSGSLITADYGISFHKPVYGVMNSIFQPSSAGLLSYIQQGLIKPLYDVSTVLDQYCHPKHHDHPNSPQDIHLDDTQQQIYQYISQHPKCQIHDILAQTGINIGDLQTALAYLEMYDLVSQPKVGIYTVLGSPVYPPNITTP